MHRLMWFIGVLTASASVCAQDSVFYVGVAHTSVKATEYCEFVLDPGTRADPPPCTNEDETVKIFGGYQINRYFAVELARTDMGKFERGTNRFGTRREMAATELVAVGMLPLGRGLSVYAKLGMFRGEADTFGTSTTSGGFTSTRLSESQTLKELTYGVGTRFDFGRRFGVRAEWQLYQDLAGTQTSWAPKEDPIDVETVSIGLFVLF
jgi:hypothetical protein